MPIQYKLIRAAKVLNCTPKELAEWDDYSYWMDWAFISENADALVQKNLSKQK